MSETSRADKDGLSYCRRMLHEAQESAWAKGNRRMSARELDRLRRAQKWREFGNVNRREGDLDGVDVENEVMNWGETFSHHDEWARKNVPGLNLLQASAGLAGGGVRGRRTDRDPKPFNKAMRRLVSRFGWEGFLDEGNLRANWENIVGPAVAQHAKIETIRGGEIVIRCDSTRWATELRLLIPQLMAAIERNSGNLVIKKLIVLGPTPPSWKHGARSVKGRGPRDTYA